MASGENVTNPAMGQPPEAAAKMAAGGSMIEALAGVVALVLAIIGLAGVGLNYLPAIAVIAVGVALLFQGASIAGRYGSLLVPRRTGHLDMSAVGGGMTSQFVAGVAGVILGVLALLNIHFVLLCAVAVIVFGAAAILGSGFLAHLSAVECCSHTDTMSCEVTHGAACCAASAGVLVGLAAVILGILAVVGINPVPLILVSLLVLGASFLLSGSAIGGRMVGMFRHH